MPETLDRCFNPGILLIDLSSGRFTSNPQANRWLGLDGSAETAHPIHCLPPRIQSGLADWPHPPVAEMRFDFRGENSAQFQVRLHSAHSPGAGSPTLIAVLNEVSPAHQLEHKMQQLDRLASIGTLSASMAHEIKNALVAIKTFVELLLKQNKDAELAGIVSRELDRIDSIVTQMLRFAGPAKPTFATVHIHEILQHALRLLKHQTQGRQITLECAFKAERDTIHGDDYQLEQAFVNLLLNSVDATGPNGQIQISTEILPPERAEAGFPERLAVRVRDSGTGISKEDQDKLFQPFFTTKLTGTGLGLPITQRIVRDHRGAINVHSELNQGTTFELLFPLPKTKPN